MPFTSTNMVRAWELIGRYPSPRSSLLPLLHLAQSQDGWVTPEAMEEIAAMLELTPAEVLGTCSFYTMFKREPVGELLVSVCTNVTCLVLGGPEMLEYLRERYAGSEDVTVEEVECLAGCGGAPCLQVNYEYHENMTPILAEEKIEAYRSGDIAARTISGVTR